MAVKKVPVDAFQYPGLVEYQYTDGKKGYGRRVWNAATKKTVLRKFDGDPNRERAIELWHGEQSPKGKRAARSRQTMRLCEVADDFFGSIERNIDRPSSLVSTRSGRRQRGVRSPNTLRTYRSDYDKYIESYFGTSCYVHQIEAHDIEEWLDWLREQPGKKEGTTLAEFSCNGKLTVLRNLLNLAVRRGAIDDDPLRFIDPACLPDQQASENYDTRVLRAEELKLLIAAAPEGWQRNLVTVLAYTGMRRAEVIALLWREVDQVEGELHLTRSLAPLVRGKAPERIALKNKWLRTPLLLPRASEALARQRDIEEAKKVGGDDDFVFTQDSYEGGWLEASTRGRPVTHERVGQVVREAATTAGLGHVTPKTLRRTAATIFARTPKLSDDAAARMLGHSLDVYFENYVKPYGDTRERVEQRAALIESFGDDEEEV